MEQSMKEFQKMVGEWGMKTFGHDERAETLLAIVNHIRKEVDELELEIVDNGTIAEECADILIMLCSIAHLKNFDLLLMSQAKMSVNYRRLWGEPDADGIIEHKGE